MSDKPKKPRATKTTAPKAPFAVPNRPAPFAVPHRSAAARYTLFVTRDSDPVTGAPTDHVEAWFALPRRFAIGERGAFWLPEAGVADRAATWSLTACRKQAGTIPDDDRQCIRIEGDAFREAS